MKIEDVNSLKGILKKAIREWGSSKIEELLPEKPISRAFVKNGMNNILSMQDEKLNKWIEYIYLFMGNGQGSIDSDSMINTIVNLFNEMPKKEYHAGDFSFLAGGGELIISFPHNFLIEMLIGDTGSVKLTTEDILDFKNLIK